MASQRKIGLSPQTDDRLGHSLLKKTISPIEDHFNNIFTDKSELKKSLQAGMPLQGRSERSQALESKYQVQAHARVLSKEIVSSYVS